jgi:protease-4
VAKLSVAGEITNTDREVEALDAVAKDARLKALVVRIDSPGGGVYASERLHDAIARVAAVKPVVAVMGDLAASGGFMAALPARRVFANSSTLTGSIGVKFETTEYSGLMSKIGVSSETIASGPLKDQPSSSHPLSEAGREELRGVMLDIYEQFVSYVAAGRHMDIVKVRALADGRVFTGRQALQAGLVDEIGDEHAARVWLAANAGVPESLPIEKLALPPDPTRAGVFRSAAEVLKSVLFQGVVIDAPKALWQPSARQ